MKGSLLETQGVLAFSIKVAYERKNMDFSNIKLNEVLRKTRKSKGMIQKQVADILKIDRSTYSYYETGKTQLDIKTALALCEIFGITLNGFLNQDNVIAESKLVTDIKRYQKSEREIPLSQYEHQLLKLVGQMDNCQRAQVIIKAQDIIEEKGN